MGENMKEVLEGVNKAIKGKIEKIGMISIVTDVVNKQTSLMLVGHERLFFEMLVQTAMNNPMFKETLLSAADYILDMEEDEPKSFPTEDEWANSVIDGYNYLKELDKEDPEEDGDQGETNV